MIDNSYIEQYGGGRRSNINWHEKYRNLLVEFAQSKAKVERLENLTRIMASDISRRDDWGNVPSEAVLEYFREKAKAEGGCDEQ